MNRFKAFRRPDPHHAGLLERDSIAFLTAKREGARLTVSRDRPLALALPPRGDLVSIPVSLPDTNCH